MGCVVAGSEGAGYVIDTVRKYRQEGIMHRVRTKKERREEQLPLQSFLERTLLAFLQKEMQEMNYNKNEMGKRKRLR